MISPESFYGNSLKKSEKVGRKLEAVEISIKKTPILKQFQSSLLGVGYLWKVFVKQCDALKYQEENQDLLIFSFEHFLKGNGSRLFLVCHPEHLWFYQNQKNPLKSSMYELIKEGACSKLYFDLEYYCDVNPSASNFIVISFIKLVIKLLNLIYCIECKEEDVIILDSSTSSKFSKHLIFPDVVFLNNHHVGGFVHFLSYIIKKLTNNTTCSSCEVSKPLMNAFNLNLFSNFEFESLVVNNRDGKSILICDEGVYTKNRNFRLYLSSKLNKNNPLVIDESCNYKFMSQKQLFFDSLITYSIEKNPPLLWHKFCYKQQSYEPKLAVLKVIESFSLSPFVEIDVLISRLISPFGSIRKWNYFSDSNCLVYEINNYKYCSNIKRQHKSNNIYYVVDLNEKVYYQKCHDPECYGFKSAPLSLTGEMTDWLNLITDISWEDEAICSQNEKLRNINISSSLNTEEHTISGLYDDCGLDSDVLLNVLESYTNNHL